MTTQPCSEDTSSHPGSYWVSVCSENETWCYNPRTSPRRYRVSCRGYNWSRDPHMLTGCTVPARSARAALAGMSCWNDPRWATVRCTTRVAALLHGHTSSSYCLVGKRASFSKTLGLVLCWNCLFFNVYIGHLYGERTRKVIAKSKRISALNAAPIWQHHLLNDLPEIRKILRQVFINSITNTILSYF